MQSEHIPCQPYDFRLYQGTDFERVFFITDSYGNPVDISNATWEMKIGYVESIFNPDVVITLTGPVPSSSDAQKGLLKIHINPSDVSNLFTIVPYGVDNVKWLLDLDIPSKGRWRVRQGTVRLERV